MVLAFRKALARLAVRVRQRRLAGVRFALVVGATPEIAVFALEAAQAAVFAVGAGEGFFRAGERLNAAVDGEYRQLRIERLIVVCDHRAVSRLALGDGIEVVFHATGVGNFQKVETTTQRLNQRRAEFGRHKLPLNHLDVSTLLDRADDAGVGGRPANALTLQRADERRLAVTRRRLGLQFENLAVLRHVLRADSQLRQWVCRLRFVFAGVIIVGDAHPAVVDAQAAASFEQRRGCGSIVARRQALQGGDR